MKILYLVNRVTETSIPWRWANYFNRKLDKSSIKIVDIKSFLKELNSLDIDIVHGHHIKAMSIFLILNRKLKLKSIYTVHGSYLFLSKSNAILLKLIFRISDKIIFVNKMLYDVLPKSYKEIIRDKYEIILNGVEIDYRYRKIDIYKKYNIDKSNKILFHPARFVKEKNHIRLISAFKILHHRDKSLKLFLAGSGKLQNIIENYVNDLNLKDSVIFLGLLDRDEVYNFLEICDIFLMPSISEGLNIAFLEAISMKSKIVVSNIEQFKYPIKYYNLKHQNLNITFVNPLCEDSIEKGIVKALSSKKSLDYDCLEFSLKNMMDKYCKIYL